MIKKNDVFELFKKARGTIDNYVHTIEQKIENSNFIDTFSRLEKNVKKEITLTRICATTAASVTLLALLASYSYIRHLAEEKPLENTNQPPAGMKIYVPRERTVYMTPDEITSENYLETVRKILPMLLNEHGCQELVSTEGVLSGKFPEDRELYINQLTIDVSAIDPNLIKKLNVGDKIWVHGTPSLYHSGRWGSGIYLEAKEISKL
ncbi:hypothetical protein JXA85_02055 [Candidatus Woesearchaeota archaeon]|nr:hypothetical protein [Candidatus Woesearchaeota archaeon]